MNSGLIILLVFIIIIIGLNLTKKLYWAMTGGIVATVVLFKLPLLMSIKTAGLTIIKWETLEVVLILYAVTYLQRLMDKKGALHSAQKSINALTNNRRLNTMLSPIVIGLLPSAAVVKICGEIVDESAGEYLTTVEKSVTASYFRHVSESFLPTYSAIIIALSLSGVSTPSFIIGMLPMAAAQILAGYLVYLRKIPKDTGVPSSMDRKKDMINILQGLWPIFTIILLILGTASTPFPIRTLWAIVIVIALYIVIGRFSPAVLIPMIKTAFEPRVIIGMFLIYIFKNLLTCTGAIESLPSLFMGLPIPQFLIFAIIFLFGSLIGGANMIHVIGIPLAYAAMPDGGMPLLVLLCCCSYIAMQISPTHICLEIVVTHFGITMGEQVKKTLPVLTIFFIIAICYYLILSLFL
jgi:integral membrane protein (TIGR00529 family)